MKIRALCVSAAAALMFTGQSFAASVSYYIDQSNALEDGVNYLQVTISDSGDDILFTVETREPLSDMAGNNFGIQSFSFNFGDSGAALDNIVAPDGWRVTGNRNHSEYGRYDVHLAGTGRTRQDPLEFSIVGISGDTVFDYVSLLSTGNASGDNQLFAAHVAGFEGLGHKSSAHFGGNTLVPLPASAWLFLTGLIVLAFRIRTTR